ncbi:hypothetical protein GCM10022409_47390 [Hymenobacter glaciei]|uniref:Uncharacterized protein n=1 Tax=Hymenobacter glaciei TaxID=877209 RepID=A0ABP7UXI5_9BACT
MCERTAATYLFQEVFPKDFPRTKKFVYFGHTEERPFDFAMYRPCGMLDSLLSTSSDAAYVARIARGKTPPKPVPLAVQARLITRYNGNSPAVTLFEHISFPGVEVVPVVVAAARGQLHCYYVFMSPMGRVMSYCSVQAIQ